MATVTFTTAPFESTEKWVGDGLLIRLSEEASHVLPTRGMAMVVGNVNGVDFQAAVEPDGERSHWFRPNSDLIESAGLSIGSSIVVELEPTKLWPEPTVPEDIQEVLNADAEAWATWQSLTPAARWDWIRWAGTARQAETRQKRIDSIPSRFRSGKRRPCCFDRNQCSLTEA